MRFFCASSFPFGILGLLGVLSISQVSKAFIRPSRLSARRANVAPLFSSASSSSSSSSSSWNDELEAIKNKVLQQIASHRQGALQKMFGWVPDGGLDIEFLPNGSTNYCFKVFEKADPSNALFVKHATDTARGFEETSLPLGRERVKYECEGYQEFGRHFADMVPRAYLADEEEGLLVCEYLSGYTALSDFLTRGEYGHPTFPTKVARLLARCHAMTTGANVAQSYQNRFVNQGHIDFWNRILFEPLLATLNDPTKHLDATKPYLVEPLTKLLTEDESLKWAVAYLQEIYNRRKESVVHGDTHSQNVLIKDGGPGEKVDLKMIDAEKTMFGPSGIDMGQFLANFAVYMAQFEAQEDIQSRLSEAMVYSWAHYEKEYLAAMATHQPNGISMTPMQVQDKLRRIFNDAIGFMGLWILFLTTTCPVDVLRLGITDEEQCRLAQTNLLHMATAALRDFQKYQTNLYDGLEGAGGWASNEATTANEGLLVNPRRYQLGGRNRGSMGVPGNNMHHIVELLRAEALPLPPIGPQDPRTPEQVEAEEEAWMNENVVQKPWATKPKDIEVWDRSRMTKEASSPLYESLVSELTLATSGEAGALMDHERSTSLSSPLGGVAAAAAMVAALEQGDKEWKQREKEEKDAQDNVVVGEMDAASAWYGGSMNFGTTQTSFPTEEPPNPFHHQQQQQQQSSSPAQQQQQQQGFSPLPFLQLDDDDDDENGVEFDDGFGNPNLILFGGDDEPPSPPSSKQKRPSSPPSRDGGVGGASGGGSVAGGGGRSKRQSWGSRGGKGGGAAGGGKGKK